MRTVRRQVCTMQVHITVDLSLWDSQTLSFNIEFQTTASQTTLVLPAMGVGNGIQVIRLRLTDVNGAPLEFAVDQDTIFVSAQRFRLAYDIQTSYAHCVGCDTHYDFLYPFINSAEIFWGSGTLAYPRALSEIVLDVNLSLQVNNLPPGWGMFSNLVADELHPATLDSFFVYCSQSQNPQTYIHHGQYGDILFRWLIQRDKSIPLSPNDLRRFLAFYFNWLEKHLGPIRIRHVHFIVLQAPENFEHIAHGRSFATGENMLNGIAVYSPKDPTCLQRLFGHGDYARFLFEGLAHELMHFYTTTAWQGKFKSRLFPAADCPPLDARMIGEDLNLYFCLQWVYEFLGKWETFLPQMLEQALMRHLTTGRRSPMLDLFLLDIALRHNAGTLLGVFGALVQAQQAEPKPYASARVLLEAAAHLGHSPPSEYPTMLLDDCVPDYPAVVRRALEQIGYSLHIMREGEVIIEKTHMGQVDYSLAK